nr:hypothetical protein [Tanacetum cinerariifolium]
FFKEAWDIVGSDVCNAAKEFFINGKLLKELNHTIIALIPKVHTPSHVNDYRPISCCNVLFKCISKIIANRIKGSLHFLINQNQSAFVPGRCISNNILLTHKLMHNYHLDRGVPRCAFKIMECVKTTSFSISINGSLHGHFKGKRGLRQGEPISPYLFTIVIEVLTLMLKRRVLLDIEQIMRGFLWSQGSLRKGRAKIKNRNFWDLLCRGNMSWGWRKVLQLCSSIREFIWYKIGDGESTSLWYDRWCSISPFADFILTRDMFRACLNTSSKVANVIISGSSKPFTVNSVWHSIWPRDVKVPWADVVWCHMRDLAGLYHVPPSLELILDIINPVARRKMSSSVISKTVLAASAYFIWQERNDSLFKNNKKSAAQIVECITSAIHLKLMSCHFKKSKAGGWHVTLLLVVQALLAVNVDEVRLAPVWVKLHNVSILAYSEVGISLISTQLGRPIMFDSYTSSMCLDLWGKCTYARVLIEMKADKELPDSLIVVVPFTNGKGHSLDKIKVEYKWKPPRCATCCTFDHNDDQCPKIVKEVKSTSTNQVNAEGFTTVNKKKNKPPPKKQVAGIRFSEGGDDPDDNWISAPDYSRGVFTVINDSDSEDVDEEFSVEEECRNVTNDNKGASTPSIAASNSSSCHKGTRIILGWNDDIVDTSIISQSDQVMHTRIWIKAERKELFCSFIYAHNHYTHRRGLWDSLCMHNCFIHNRPWCIIGDFNADLNIEDASVGSLIMDISMWEFKECIKEIELMDVPRSGLQFTWNQKPHGLNGILKKLDWVMANVEFSNGFVGNYVVFQPYGISDHSPAVLRISLQNKLSPQPFKFANVVATFPRFKEVVKEGWSAQVSGFYMFRVVKKLKSLKKPLRKLLYDKGNLHDNVSKLRIEMARLQQDLDLDPSNPDLRDEEVVYVSAFTEALIMEERFLKQKAKVEWLKVGDSNSAYFHKSVKGRTSRNRIDVVTNLGRNLVTGEGVPAAFVSYYEAFLGQPGITSSFDSNNLFMNRLNSDQALDMIEHVTTQEMKEALFSMGNAKSSGPDGYTACFFKECSDIVATDIICAVQEFFTNGNLLKELNHTIIVLIPKDNSPSRINDYRPISCCNVRDSDRFRYHRYCSNLEIINLYFVDDLFIFAHGDPYSTKVIMKAMDEFKNASGLTPSLPKSTAYFCNVLNHTKLFILQILPFEEGRLQVKYLGVPLVSSRLVFRDCKELIDRIRSRINDWKHKSLSAARRLQLVQSVLGSMHVYWASIFILPARILLNIEQLIRGFLWCHGELKKGRAKVSWDVVCLPKIKGGIGVCKLDLFNKALMVPHIWNLISRKESLWVKWIHEYKLRGRHFFDVPYRGCMTWGWRKLLQLRPII